MIDRKLMEVALNVYELRDRYLPAWESGDQRELEKFMHLTMDGLRASGYRQVDSDLLMMQLARQHRTEDLEFLKREGHSALLQRWLFTKGGSCRGVYWALEYCTHTDEPQYDRDPEVLVGAAELINYKCREFHNDRREGLNPSEAEFDALVRDAVAGERLFFKPFEFVHGVLVGEERYEDLAIVRDHAVTDTPQFMCAWLRTKTASYERAYKLLEFCVTDRDPQ